MIKMTLQVFGLFYLVAFNNAKEMKYFSNFKHISKSLWGDESLVNDYVTIANDPVSDLPEKFTICSSLFINISTTNKNVFEIYKEDGTHWFQLSFTRSSRTRTLEMFYQTGKFNCQAYINSGSIQSL